MLLLQLPRELSEMMIKALIASLSMREVLRLRLVNSLFAQQIQQVLKSSQAQLVSPYTEATPHYQQEWERKERNTAVVLAEKGLSRADLCSQLSDELLACRESFDGTSVLSQLLKETMSILMSTPELQFTDIQGDKAARSKGFLEDHASDTERMRLIRIASLIPQALICARSLKKVTELMRQQCHDTFVQQLQQFCFSSIDVEHFPQWAAVTTAMFIGDVPATMALIAGIDAYTRQPRTAASAVLPAYTPEALSQQFCQRDFFELAIKLDKRDLIPLIWEFNPDVKGACFRNEDIIPLAVACQYAFPHMVKIFLSSPVRRVEPQSYPSALRSAARCSCQYQTPATCTQRTQIIEMLWKETKPAEAEKVKDLPLREASKYGCPNVARMLLDAGADPNQRTHFASEFDCLFPMAYAASHGHVAVMELLLERGAGRAYLFFPAVEVVFDEEAANPHMLAYISEQGAKIMQRGPLEVVKADFILKQAAVKNCPLVVDCLVHAGYNHMEQDRGLDALHDAVSNGSTDVVRMLQKHGVTVGQA